MRHILLRANNFLKAESSKTKLNGHYQRELPSKIADVNLPDADVNLPDNLPDIADVNLPV